LIQFSGDRRLNARGILQHLVVPEPQYAVPLTFEEPRAARLFCGREIVLAAIDFDDQLRLMADKVGDKAPERCLAAKSVTSGLPQT
jgi:hypothetical protein